MPESLSLFSLPQRGRGWLPLACVRIAVGGGGNASFGGDIFVVRGVMRVV